MALPTLGQAGCQIRTLELPIKMVGLRAVATVGINGTSVPLTVDSGAFFSFLTEAAAAQLQLHLTRNSASRPEGVPEFHLNRNSALRVEGLTGRVDAYTTRVDKLQLLKGEMSHVEFIVGGNEPGAGTMGLMGRNLLSFTDTEYDLAHGVIRFLYPNDDCAKSNMAYWAGSSPVTEIDLVTENRDGKAPAIRAHAKLNGSELTALFDTGARTVVSLRAARRAGVTESAMAPAGTSYGAGSGSAKTWTAAFEKFEIGGETILHNRLHVADFDLEEADMLLGIDFFLSHRIYVSKKQSKMFFTYNGGAVFALDKSASASALDPSAAPAASDATAVTADQLARRGASSAARRNYEDALADLNRAIELEPQSAALFAQRGVIHQALRLPAQALDDFDKALELDPTQADARLRRVSLRISAKNREGAKADLDALDHVLASEAQMRLAMSRLYVEIEQYAQALVQLNDWLSAHPHEVKRDAALNSRCWTRLLLGIELDQALDDCNEAIDGDSKNPAYFDSRGW
ncbi:MAG: aspartyl protease family protein, partial [Ginsengibacter sp.]